MVGTLTLAERAARARAEQAAEFERRREAAEQRRLEELTEAGAALLASALPVLRQRFHPVGASVHYVLADDAPIRDDLVYAHPVNDDSVVFALRRRGDGVSVYLADTTTPACGDEQHRHTGPCEVYGKGYRYVELEVRSLEHLGELLDDRTRPKGEPVDDVPATAAGEAALEAGAAAVTPSGA